MFWLRNLLIHYLLTLLTLNEPISSDMETRFGTSKPWIDEISTMPQTLRARFVGLVIFIFCFKNNNKKSIILRTELFYQTRVISWTQFLNTRCQVSFWNYLFLEFSLELELQQKVESFFLLVIQSSQERIKGTEKASPIHTLFHG